MPHSGSCRSRLAAHSNSQTRKKQKSLFVQLALDYGIPSQGGGARNGLQEGLMLPKSPSRQNRSPSLAWGSGDGDGDGGRWRAELGGVRSRGGCCRGSLILEGFRPPAVKPLEQSLFIIPVAQWISHTSSLSEAGSGRGENGTLRLGGGWGGEWFWVGGYRSSSAYLSTVW